MAMKTTLKNKNYASTTKQDQNNNYIYLATYNSEQEFYKKMNCILQGKKYNGFEYKKTFKIIVNNT